MHRNVFQAFSNIVTANGPRGLYLGYLPTLLRDVPEMAVQARGREEGRVGVPVAPVRRRAGVCGPAKPACGACRR